jgi:hypothetical protein
MTLANCVGFDDSHVVPLCCSGIPVHGTWKMQAECRGKHQVPCTHSPDTMAICYRLTDALQLNLTCCCYSPLQDVSSTSPTVCVLLPAPQIPPYLHILRPVKKEARAEAMSEEEGNATVEEMLQALLAQKQGGGRGGGSEKGGGGDDGGDSDDGGDGGSAGNGTRGGGGSISLGGFGSTRSTYLDAFGSSRGRQTMTRMATMSRMATMNRMQSTRSMARQLVGACDVVSALFWAAAANRCAMYCRVGCSMCPSQCCCKCCT